MELNSAKELHCPKCKADIDGNTIEVWTAKWFIGGEENEMQEMLSEYQKRRGYMPRLLE